MSFGFSIGDLILLTQLSWKIVQNSQQACGAHGELTREVTSLHLVLQRLQTEVASPASIINRINDGRREELRTIVEGCNRQLKVLDQVLTKYNGLSEETRKTTRLWQKIKFGNGEMKDLGKIRQELATHTAAITLLLNLLSMGSQGRVEKHMENHSAEMRELRSSLNWITASLQASNLDREGSILTSYGDDDKKIWKEFRRELLVEGFSSSILRRNKHIIKDYVLELGARGALDVPENDNIPTLENGIVMEEQAYDDELDEDSSSETEGEELSQEALIAVQTPSSSTRDPGQSPPRDRSTVLADFELVDPLDRERSPCTTSPMMPDHILDVGARRSDSISDPSSLERPVTDTADTSFITASSEPKQVSIEEVEDEEFKIGAHPNCGSDEELHEDLELESNGGHNQPCTMRSFKHRPYKRPRGLTVNYKLDAVIGQNGFDYTHPCIRRSTSISRVSSSLQTTRGSVCRWLRSAPIASSSSATDSEFISNKPLRSKRKILRRATIENVSSDSEIWGERTSSQRSPPLNRRTKHRLGNDMRYIIDNGRSVPISRRRAVNQKVSGNDEPVVFPCRTTNSNSNNKLSYIVDNGRSIPVSKPSDFNREIPGDDELAAVSSHTTDNEDLSATRSTAIDPRWDENKNHASEYMEAVRRKTTPPDEDDRPPPKPHKASNSIRYISENGRVVPVRRSRPANLTVDEDNADKISKPVDAFTPTHPPTDAPPGELYGFTKPAAPLPCSHSRQTVSWGGATPRAFSPRYKSSGFFATTAKTATPRRRRQASPTPSRPQASHGDSDDGIRSDKATDGYSDKAIDGYSDKATDGDSDKTTDSEW